MQKLNQKGFTGFEITLLLLIAAAVGFAGYTVYQRNQDQASTTQTVVVKKGETENNTDNTKAPAASTDISDQLFAGQVDFNLENNRGSGDNLLIDGYAKISGDTTAIYLQYGKTPTTLTSQTEKLSEGIGLGDADTYGSFTFTINKNSLDPGINYFYRVVAENKDGKKLYSGVSAFTSRK